MPEGSRRGTANGRRGKLLTGLRAPNGDTDTIRFARGEKETWSVPPCSKFWVSVTRRDWDTKASFA